MTAYFGLLDVGRPEPGETVVVSGAAGAVGQRRRPDREDQGLPRDRDRRRAGEVRAGSSTSSASTRRSTTRRATSARSCASTRPNGVDVFFDNVGGEILDAVLARLARGARVVLCGAISQYNATEPLRGPANYMELLVDARVDGGLRGLRLRGPYARGRRGARRLARAGELQLARGRARGRHRRVPEALLRLFRGENIGKLVLALPAGD